MSDKRLGRPPLDPEDPSTHLHVRIPSKQYAGAASRARLERVTVPDWIRRTLRDALDDPPPRK